MATIERFKTVLKNGKLASAETGAIVELTAQMKYDYLVLSSAGQILPRRVLRQQLDNHISFQYSAFSCHLQACSTIVSRSPNIGFHPKILRALSLLPTSFAGSPARRLANVTRKSLPVTRFTASTTSSTDVPTAFPRLNESLSPPSSR